MKLVALLVGALGLGVAATSPASASLYNFELTGSQQAAFQLESSTPSSFTPVNPVINVGQSVFNNVSGTFAGSPGVASIYFGEGLAAAFQITGIPALGFTQFGGSALFTGDPSNPVFDIGSFTLINPFFGLTDTLTISQASATPLPASWTMMFIGLAGFGFAAYHRRKNKPAADYQLAVA